MNKLLVEIRARALIYANRMKSEMRIEDCSEVKEAYARALNLNKVICPACWVCRGVPSELTIETTTLTANFYSCDKCDFKEALSKEAHPS